MARVLARASVGSGSLRTYPLSSSAVTSRVRVDGAIPSTAARSPSRIGPERPTVASAASCVGVRPASSCRRSRRDSRASATRNLVTSISGPLTSRARALTAGSVLTFSAYAVPAVGWSPAERRDKRGNGAERFLFHHRAARVGLPRARGERDYPGGG